MMITAGAWALLAVAQVATTTAADLAPTNTSSAARDPRIEALVLAAHGIEKLAAVGYQPIWYEYTMDSVDIAEVARG